MKNKILKSIVVGTTICIAAANIQASSLTWNEKLGIEKVYYPEFNDNIGANSYFSRLGYGMSEGIGVGINLLVVDYKGEDHPSVNNTKSLYKYIIPGANITYIEANSTTYKNLSNIITEEMIDSNDIICISKFDYKDPYLLDLVDSRPDKYFVISGESASANSSEFVKYIENLNNLYNTLIVAGSCSEGIDKTIITKDVLSLIDVFVQVAPTTKDNTESYMYHSYSNESGRMDNAIGLVASSLAILLENKTPLNDIGNYYRKHAKLWKQKIKYGSYSFDPITEYELPLLDYKILFQKADNNNFISNIYNIPSKYQGEQVQIALVDSENISASSTQGYIKKMISFPTGYQASAGSDTSESLNLDILRGIIPKAEVTLLSAKSDLVSGDRETTYLNNALDWILDNSDKIKILLMNAPIEVQKDKELQKKVKLIADKGIVVSWTWMPKEYSSSPNIITPSIFYGKKSYGRYLTAGNDISVYDRFFNEFDTNNKYDWGNFAASSVQVALSALFEQMKPGVSGTEIKSLYGQLAVETDNLKDVKLPNIGRIATMLENHLTYEHDFTLTPSEITISFNESTDTKINGIQYRGVKETIIPYTSILSIAIDRKGERIAEGSQLIDIDVLKSESGTVYLDSTFNGRIVTDVGEIQIKRGLNKVGYMMPNVARDITIYYDIK